MGIFDRFRRPVQVEARSGATFTQSSPDFLELFGLNAAASGITVTTENALGVPAIWAAVNFLAATFAGLPLDVIERIGDDKVKVKDNPLTVILHDAVNDGLTSFDWRKGKLESVLTGGRGLTFIERNTRKEVINLWPLNPAWTTVKLENGRKIYVYRAPGAPEKRYEASEVIDLAYMMKPDGVGHRGPITTNRDVIALAIAATEFGSKYFLNGGVPPFAVTGNFQSGAAMTRAAGDLAEAVKTAAKEKRQALVLPSGMDIKPLGADAERSQLVELKRFLVEEVARIYSMPPVFLQDLTHGTYTNTEQQDLHFVKHTLRRWVVAFEQECNLKLFGRDNRTLFVEINMDGLLRGDFKTRMDGYAAAIQNAILMPDEARAMENRPAVAGGDQLMIQGATVPLAMQGKGKPNGA
jgi:HK97 family phage portal protein